MHLASLHNPIWKAISIGRYLTRKGHVRQLRSRAR